MFRYLSTIGIGALALLLQVPVLAQDVRINDVRIAHTDNRTRIVLDLSRSAEHKLFTLSNPNRVVVDLAGGEFVSGSLKLPKGTGLVAGMRSANRDDGKARLVLDLDAAARAKSFLIPPSGSFGYRVVIDLESTGAAPVVVKKVPDKQQGNRDLIVVIDPGHGGKDPGAHGKGGLREKDAVLQISKRLVRIINDEPGMRAVLTRNNDSFLHLRQRIKRAENAHADMFVSIHADSFTDRRVRGASVYVLSEKGATDEAADLLAKRENESDLIGGVDITDKDDVLASVLVDLSQNASLEASLEVGDLFVAELSRIGKVRRPTVQKAGFLVLKSPDIPSVLIETAFISNRHDESNLKSVQYQQRLAQSMHNAIRGYFYQNPPYGTQVARLSAAEQASHRHVIRSGETLSGIAKAYKVSISRIRAANRLRSTSIKIGQVLTIPPAVDT